MRKLTFLAIATSMLMACSGPSGKEKAVGSADINIKLDQAKMGILGPVKTFKQGSWVVNFNEAGRSDLMEPEDKVSFKGRTRNEMTLHGHVSYSFDDLGRVVQVEEMDYVAKYSYEGDNYYPSSMKSDYAGDDFEEASSETHVYKYKDKDFDEYGNWLVRTDNGEKEVREITYFDVPKPVPTVYFKTPEAAIKASLKARQKGDLDTFLAATVGPNASRSGIEMVTDIFEISQMEKDRIRFFKVGKAEIDEAQNRAEVHVTVARGDEPGEKWKYLAVKDEDGYWHDALMGVSED